MMYINQYRRENRYDVIVLDAAPTAESMRFISMPTTLDWYMKHIFPFQRTLLKAVRPIANRVAPFELPTDSYFANIRDLFEKLGGVDEIMEDTHTTSVRLVTNPEKMGLRDTAGAFPLTVRDQGRYRAVQEGRGTGRGGRHAATPYRHAPLDGHADTRPSAARKSDSHCRNEGGTMSEQEATQQNATQPLIQESCL